MNHFIVQFLQREMIRQRLYQYLQEFNPSYKPFILDIIVNSGHFKKSKFQVSYQTGSIYEIYFEPVFINIEDRPFLDVGLPVVNDKINQSTVGYILSEPNGALYILYRDDNDEIHIISIDVVMIEDLLETIGKILVNNQSIIFIDNNFHTCDSTTFCADYIPFLRYNMLTLILIFKKLRNFYHFYNIRLCISNLIYAIKDDIDELGLGDEEIKQLEKIIELFYSSIDCLNDIDYYKIIFTIINKLEDMDTKYTNTIEHSTEEYDSIEEYNNYNIEYEYVFN